MTLAELWELFPIFLVQHDDKWKNYYKEIEASIMDLLPDYPVERISHIGSTAIKFLQTLMQTLVNQSYQKMR